MKDKADLTQMLYATPLTEDQMAKLSANVTAAEAGVELPTEVRLFQNYPNPFNPSTTISFFLPEAMDVRLTLYDALGREVKVLMDDAMRASGEYTITFDASELTSGSYLYRLEGPEFVQSRMLTLVE